jgi:hypothetical protein
MIAEKVDYDSAGALVLCQWGGIMIKNDQSVRYAIHEPAQ